MTETVANISRSTRRRLIKGASAAVGALAALSSRPAESSAPEITKP